jgi:hypothetical protein
MLELGPHSSHVAGILDPLIIGEDAMNGGAPLIPIFRQNFRVHVAVEGVCYMLNIIRIVRTNRLLRRIDLETYNFCRLLDNCISPAVSMSNERKPDCWLLNMVWAIDLPLGIVPSLPSLP